MVKGSRVVEARHHCSKIAVFYARRGHLTITTKTGGADEFSFMR